MRVGGLKSHVLVGSLAAFPPKLKVARLLSHRSRCCHLVVGIALPAPWQPPAHAAAPPPVCQIAGAAVHPAALPVLCSSRPSADGRAVSEDEQHNTTTKENEPTTSMTASADRRELGRTNEPTTHSLLVVLFRRPRTKENQNTAAADEKLIALQAGWLRRISGPER